MIVKLPILGTSLFHELCPSKIIAVGLNYRAHIEESMSVKIRGMDGKQPEEPVLFNKTPNVLIGNGESIRIPSLISAYPWAAKARTDYEGELVVIMGKGGKNIAPDEALEHVLGYSCGNDVSQRNIQNSDRSGWFRGKSFDSFGPVGPVMVPRQSLKDPGHLAIETRLNGRTVQSSSTEMMIFPIPQLISFVSRQFTLEPGDLIFTGTPSGVGPLADGDIIEVEIEGIGTLSNPVSVEREHGTSK